MDWVLTAPLETSEGVERELESPLRGTTQPARRQAPSENKQPTVERDGSKHTHRKSKLPSCDVRYLAERVC